MTMSCPDAEQLEHFADHRLSEDARSTVASHVSICRECGALVSQFRENQSVLEELARLTPKETRHAASQPVPTDIPGFRIIRELGRGGMGIVYEAQQQSPARRVAVKIVRGGRLIDEHQLKLFHRETKALARLRHPNIAAIYDAGHTEDGQPFFAMELLQGDASD
ncbi:MAG: protein kinase, partial [Planctomycetes bacterium]|nr:protein kinase [Planctomycetota bacterium]